MSRSMCYLAAPLAAYKKLKKGGFGENGFAGLLTEDELYDQLEHTLEGVEFVDRVDDVDEWTGKPEWGWLRRDANLCLDDSGDDFRIWFPSERSRQEWFRKPHEAYVKELHAIVAGDTLKNFSSYELLSPDYNIGRMYNRQWSGYVACVNEDGVLVDLEYPMEFLRDIKTRANYVVARKGWVYK